MATVSAIFGIEARRDIERIFGVHSPECGFVHAVLLAVASRAERRRESIVRLLAHCAKADTDMRSLARRVAAARGTGAAA